MMKHQMIRLVSAVSVCALAGACSQNYRPDPILLEADTELGGREPWVVKSQSTFSGVDVRVLDPYRYRPEKRDRSPAPNGQTPDDKRSLYDIASDSSSTTADPVRQTARNDLQEAILRFSDDAMAVHLAGVRAAETNLNLVLGAVGIGLTGGASVASGAAASALAAAATGTQGARALVNEQVYRNTLTESIINLIEADRAETLRQIRVRQAYPISQYGVEAAIRDAEEYHNKGSLYHGLALIRAAAEEKAKDIAKSLGDDKAADFEATQRDVVKAKNDLKNLADRILFTDAQLTAGQLTPERKTQLETSRAQLKREHDGLVEKITSLTKAIAEAEATIIRAKAAALPKAPPSDAPPAPGS